MRNKKTKTESTIYKKKRRKFRKTKCKKKLKETLAENFSRPFEQMRN